MLTQLTPTEKKVLAILVKGYSDKEIATKLNISYRTVQYYTQSIYSKLSIKGSKRSRLTYLFLSDNLEFV